jgi:hypothetical protein
LTGVLRRPGEWPLRLLWLILPVTAGVAFGDALEGAEDPFRTTVSIALWVLWALTLLALLVPHPLTLTLARIAVPAATVATTWAIMIGEARAAPVAGLVAAGLATVLVLLPATGDLFVDGASYGSERRFALRAPAALWLGPVPLAWVVVVSGLCGGPLLLADEQWVAGAIGLVVGWPLAFAALRALHGLSRRWLVFVPAGFVVHDLATLQDPVLVPARTVRSLDLAPAPGAGRSPGEPAPTFGTAVAARLDPPLTVSLRGAALAEVHHLDRVVVCPGRPGAVLVEAAERGLRVGVQGEP